jgi:hypothetical protein
MFAQYHQDAMLMQLQCEVGRFVPAPPQACAPPPEEEKQQAPAIAVGDRDKSPPKRSAADDRTYLRATSNAQKEHDRRVAEKNKQRKIRYEKSIEKAKKK